MGASSSAPAQSEAVDLNVRLLRKGARAAFPLRADKALPGGVEVWSPAAEMPDALIVSLSDAAVEDAFAAGGFWAAIGYPKDGGRGDTEWTVRTQGGEAVYGPVRGAAAVPPPQAVAFLRAAATLSPSVRLVGRLAAPATNAEGTAPT